MADRKLRRIALLIFPGVSLNEAQVDRLTDQGYTDVAIGVFQDMNRPSAMAGTGV